MKILLVDDDRGDRAQLMRELQKTPFRAETLQATTLDEARKAIDQHQPDAVLLDYQIPGIDQLEGLEKLRSLHPFLPIVLVTGYGDELLAARAINTGADDYIPKQNLNADTLENAINNAIEKTRLREKVGEQQRDLENFAHILSHDLRAPLNQIQTLTDILVEDLHDQRFDDVVTYAQHLTSSANDASALIKMLTEFLDPNSDITTESIDLNRILDETIDCLGLKNQNPAKVDADTLPEVWGNTLLLRQIFQNLIGNALKYNRGEYPRVMVSHEQDGDSYLIHFDDNGIGINPDEGERIFEPFVRLNPGNQFQGSGLGLSICRKNIRRLGGNIGYHSLPDGTRFTLTIRANKPLQE